MPKQNTRRPDKKKNEKHSLPKPPVQSHQPFGPSVRDNLRTYFAPAVARCEPVSAVPLRPIHSALPPRFRRPTLSLPLGRQPAPLPTPVAPLDLWVGLRRAWTR
jgi:hypothetical protein